MRAIQAWYRGITSGRTILQRGESAVAPMGCAVAVILLVAIGTTLWWSHRIRQAQVADTTFDQVRATGHLLRSSVEPLLVTDDLSAVRRLVVQTTQRGNLSQCRIVLLDGQVLADADPSRILGRCMTYRPRIRTGLSMATRFSDVAPSCGASC